MLRPSFGHSGQWLQVARRRRASRVRRRAGAERPSRRERDEVGSLSQPTASRKGADWRRAVEPYIGPNARRASFQLVTTLVPLALTMWAIHTRAVVVARSLALRSRAARGRPARADVHSHARLRARIVLRVAHAERHGRLRDGRADADALRAMAPRSRAASRVLGRSRSTRSRRRPDAHRSRVSREVARAHDSPIASSGIRCCSCSADPFSSRASASACAARARATGARQTASVWTTNVAIATRPRGRDLVGRLEERGRRVR